MIGPARAAIIHVMPSRTGIDPRDIEVIDDGTAELLRGLTGAQRLEIASQMHALVRATIRIDVARRHPDWDEERVKREAGWRLLYGAY